MKSLFTRLTLLSFMAVMLTSCSVIEGIFKAGMGVGIFIVIAIIAIIIFVISKFSSKK